MPAFIALWAIQVLFSAWIFSQYKKDAGISENLERDRAAAITVGFIPCVGIMLAFQLFYFNRYKAGLTRHLTQVRVPAQAPARVPGPRAPSR